MSDVYKRAENENYRLTIFNDNDSESPRDWDNIGTLVTFSRNLSGDKHDFKNKDHFLASLVNEVVDGYIEDAEEFISEVICKNIKRDDYKGSGNYVRAIDDAIIAFLESKGFVILPVYMYSHSGITISTAPFSCNWDSGQVGWIYASPDTIIKEHGAVNEETLERTKKYMEGEIETYDQFITGEVYGFSLEKKVKCECCSHVEYEEEDACGGFYGDDFKTNGIIDHLGHEHEGLVNEL